MASKSVGGSSRMSKSKKKKERQVEVRWPQHTPPMLQAMRSMESNMSMGSVSCAQPTVFPPYSSEEQQDSFSSNPLDEHVLDEALEDLNNSAKALFGPQHESYMYPQHLPSIPRVGDGEQEPLHKSWNPQQPGQEDVARMHAESLADQGMPDADAEYPDTSSYWTEPTDLEYLSNLRLEDWINPELLQALKEALSSPVPKTELFETEHGFLFSYHKGHSKPYVCECEGCDLEDRSFETRSALKKHQKNHVAEHKMPWGCPKCPKKFALPHYLARHLATKHSDARPVPCDECEKSFKRRDGLQAHKKRLHSSTPSSSGRPKTPKTPSTAPKRRHRSKSIVSSSSSHLQGLSSRMDGIEIASSSSYPFSPTPTTRPYCWSSTQ